MSNQMKQQQGKMPYIQSAHNMGPPPQHRPTMPYATAGSNLSILGQPMPGQPMPGQPMPGQPMSQEQMMMMMQAHAQSSVPGAQRTVVEYVWDMGGDIRAKSRIIRRPVAAVEDVPPWEHVEANQQTGQLEKIWLTPRQIYSCPFRRANNVIVVCNHHNSVESANAALQRRAPQSNDDDQHSVVIRFAFINRATRRYIGVSDESKEGSARQLVEDSVQRMIAADLSVDSFYQENVAGRWRIAFDSTSGHEVDDLCCAHYIIERVADIVGAAVQYIN